MVTDGLHERGGRSVFGQAGLSSLFLLLLAPFAALAPACEGATARSEECLPGDFEVSSLADGGSGFLECNPSGTAYVLYDGPNPNVAPDAGAPDASGEAGADEDAAAACSSAGGAKLGFMCPGCLTDSDCQAGMVCFDFPNKTGNICTRACTPAQQSTLCPPPSEGCGNNGHCKP